MLMEIPSIVHCNILTAHTSTVLYIQSYYSVNKGQQTSNRNLGLSGITMNITAPISDGRDETRRYILQLCRAKEPEEEEPNSSGSTAQAKAPHKRAPIIQKEAKVPRKGPR